MGMMKAAQLAPDAILLPIDFDEYRRYSRLFKAAVRAIAPVIEDRGIDEIYIDLTDVPGAQARRAAARVGQALKDAVRAATGLDLLDRRDAEQAAVEDLLRARQARRPDAARRGRHPDAHLAAAGAQGQRHRPEGQREARGARHRRRSASSPRPTRRCCSQHFGSSYGAWLHDAAHGRDERPVVDLQRAEVDQPRDHLRARPARGARPRRARRASSPSCASSSPATSRARATSAAPSASSCASTTSRSVTRDLTLPAPTHDAAAIRRAAGECLKRVDLSAAAAPARRARGRLGPARRPGRAAGRRSRSPRSPAAWRAERELQPAGLRPDAASIASSLKHPETCLARDHRHRRPARAGEEARAAHVLRLRRLGLVDREHLPRQRERLPAHQVAPARRGQHGEPHARARR